MTVWDYWHRLEIGDLREDYEEAFRGMQANTECGKLCVQVLLTGSALRELVKTAGGGHEQDVVAAMAETCVVMIRG